MVKANSNFPYKIYVSNLTNATLSNVMVTATSMQNRQIVTSTPQATLRAAQRRDPLVHRRPCPGQVQRDRCHGEGQRRRQRLDLPHGQLCQLACSTFRSSSLRSL